LTKTTTLNYLSIAAPGNSFNNRISADSDIFARNDIDALGNALDLHDHTSGKGLAVGALATTVTLTGATTFTGAAVLFPSGVNSGLTINTGGLTVTAGGGTITAGGLTVTAGNVGIGTAAQTGRAIEIQAIPSTGGGTRGIVIEYTADSSSTSLADGFVGNVGTAAAAFTCTTLSQFHALNPPKGAGSTITNAYGLLVDAITSGNTNNYGINIGAPSGGSGLNLGLYNGGLSRFDGGIGISTPAVASKISIASAFLPARVSGDLYLIWNPSTGEVHQSAVGPAS
jgi:hypothetical protein